MQERHHNRKQYFNELANTAREYYLDYLRPYLPLTPFTRVLEIGCGDGGNLLPFAEAGCSVTGVDLSSGRIADAQRFFAESGYEGTFLCQNFIQSEPPTDEDARYDLVLVHDVIEHIEPPYKQDFLAHIRPFLRRGGIVFFGFPAWQNPFGGHQQICAGFASKLPYIHLLPLSMYTTLLEWSGASEKDINELLSIRRARVPIESFEELAVGAGFSIKDRTLWLINPHYKQKFHLQPRRLWPFFADLTYVRNFYTTSAFYLLQ